MTLEKKAKKGPISFTTPDGKGHRYLNVEIPRAQPLIHSLCDVCGHGYAECIRTGANICPECKLESVMDLAARLQAEGIELGAHTPDKRAEREKFARKWRGRRRPRPVPFSVLLSKNPWALGV